MYLYYIVYVKLQQIIFQNINTSSHPHIKSINFCYPEILCSDWKRSDQNNTAAQSMLSFNQIQFKQFQFTSLLLCLLNFCHIRKALPVSKNIKNK